MYAILLVYSYLILYFISLQTAINNDEIRNYLEGPITYYHILSFFFLPFLVLFWVFPNIIKFIIQVHKNSTQSKSKPKPKSSISTFEFYNSRINAMIKEKIRMRNILNNCIKERKPRPIPEILEELDEAVEDRDA